VRLCSSINHDLVHSHGLDTASPESTSNNVATSSPTPNTCRSNFDEAKKPPRPLPTMSKLEEQQSEFIFISHDPLLSNIRPTGQINSSSPTTPTSSSTSSKPVWNSTFQTSSSPPMSPPNLPAVPQSAALPLRANPASTIDYHNFRFHRPTLEEWEGWISG